MPYIYSGRKVSAVSDNNTCTSSDLRRFWGENRVNSLRKNRDRGKREHILHETIRTRIPKHRRLRFARREQKHEDGRQHREYRKRELAPANREPTRTTCKINHPAGNKRAGDTEDRDDGVVAVGLVQATRSRG